MIHAVPFYGWNRRLQGCGAPADACLMRVVRRGVRVFWLVRMIVRGSMRHMADRVTLREQMPGGLVLLFETYLANMIGLHEIHRAADFGIHRRIR